MDVTLPPDLEAYVERLAASDEFRSSEAVIERALRLFKSERKRVLALVQEGIDSADRGELRDGAEVMAELLDRYKAAEAKLSQVA